MPEIVFPPEGIDATFRPNIPDTRGCPGSVVAVSAATALEIAMALGAVPPPCLYASVNGSSVLGNRTQRRADAAKRRKGIK